MGTCTYSECENEFIDYKNGCVQRKYCKEHSIIVRKEKVKEYSKKYIRLKRRSRIKSVGNRKCCTKSCRKLIPSIYSLARKYCDRCARQRRNESMNKSNHEVKHKLAFKNIRAGIRACYVI